MTISKTYNVCQAFKLHVRLIFSHRNEDVLILELDQHISIYLLSD